MWKWKKHLIFDVIGCHRMPWGTNIFKKDGRTQSCSWEPCQLHGAGDRCKSHDARGKPLLCHVDEHDDLHRSHHSRGAAHVSNCAALLGSVCAQFTTATCHLVSQTFLAPSDSTCSMTQPVTTPFFQRCPLSFLEMKKNIKEHKADFPISFSWNVNWTSHPCSKSCS